MSIRERIENGARALDQRVPGWERHVNPAILDITSPRVCVLGQVFGNYCRGMAELGLGEAGGPFGFCPASLHAANQPGAVLGLKPPFSDWQELNAEWRKFLAEREAVGV